MATTEQLKEVLLYPESTPNEKPSTIKSFGIKLESFGLQAQQQSETNTLLGGGRGASAKAFGATDVSGDLGFIISTENAPILLSHAIGTRTQVPTAVTHSTALPKSTNVTRGTRYTHSTVGSGLEIVVTKSGRTSSSTPSFSGKTDGYTLTYGSAEVKVVKKLWRHTGGRSDHLHSFGIEVTATDGTNNEYCTYTGVYMNSFPFSISGSTNAVKAGISCVGMGEMDSLVMGGAYNTIRGHSTLTEVGNDYFYLEDCTFKMNGQVASTKTTQFDITINNNITIEDGLNKAKIENFGIVSIEGSFSVLMDKDLYKDALNHVNKNIEFIFEKDTGEKLILKFPQLKLERTYREFSTDKSVMLTVPFSAFDTDTVTSVTWECFSPLKYQL